MRAGCAIIAGLLVVNGHAALAVELKLPEAATVTATETADFTSMQLAIGPWKDDDLLTIWAEGALTRRAIRIDAYDTTTSELSGQLRNQLVDEGFDILFECRDVECGGFDFRFQTRVLPEPDMHVDLGDYRYISAQRAGETRPEYISLLISRSIETAYVQIAEIGGNQQVSPISVLSSKAPPDQITGDLAAELELSGSIVLRGLAFPTGSSRLADQGYAVLKELAEYLNANPERKIMLVGHTDSEGSLSGNVSLSKKRAKSVARRLIETYGVDKSQVSSDGVGFLAPRASNLTPEGRTENRRVEAILTSTQ